MAGSDGRSAVRKFDECILAKTKYNASDDKVRAYFIRAAVRLSRRGFSGEWFADRLANRLDNRRNVRRAFGGDVV